MSNILPRSKADSLMANGITPKHLGGHLPVVNSGKSNFSKFIGSPLKPKTVRKSELNLGQFFQETIVEDEKEHVSTDGKQISGQQDSNRIIYPQHRSMTPDVKTQSKTISKKALVNGI